jgi:Zn-dependent protease with chaperone function
MNAVLRKSLPVLGLLFLARGACADPPPPAELSKLLKSEPINTANWPRWSARLRAWSGEHFHAAFPAFTRAFDFVKQQLKDPTGNRLDFPPALRNDAVAWMLLAGAYLHDAKPRLGPVAMARLAHEAARQSIRRDRHLARAHFYLCWAYEREQLTSPEKGGPARPDVNRLRDALRELQEARTLDPGVKWLSALEAGRLAVRAEKWDDAETYLRQALKEKPRDVGIARLLARAINEQVSPWYRRSEPFAASLRPLVEQFPGDGVLVSRYGYALLQDNRRGEAAVQFEKARRLGTDPARVVDPNKVREIDREQARNRPQESGVAAPLRFARVVGWWALGFTVVYVIVMGLMCVGGLVLGRWTRGPAAAALLGSAPGQLAAAGRVARTRHESWLTRCYAVALLLALLLFYLSLPFVFVGLLLVFLVLVVLAMFLRRDQEVGDVHAALLRASGGGMGAVLKAMFARTGSGNFGLRKTRTDCPRLYQAVEEVARRVDTEPVDEIYLSPGAEFSVYQEGRGPFGVFGGRKHVLTLGLCVMNFLSVSEFKAILAHEYAHFSHADTFWNRFLFQVTLSLRTALREMARTGGWVTWVNPFYWFFWLYSKSYSLLSAGFSRSREFLADRMACALYGAEVFARGLMKVCTDGTHFEMTVYTNIARLLKHKKAYVNMYLAFRQFRDQGMTEEERRGLHRKLLDDKPSLFASHPTIQERLTAARQLPRAQRTEDASSLQLFEKPEAVEQELTDFLTEVVARYLRV